MVGKILYKAKKNIISSHGRARATTQTLPILFTHNKKCVWYHPCFLKKSGSSKIMFQEMTSLAFRENPWTYAKDSPTKEEFIEA